MREYTYSTVGYVFVYVHVVDVVVRSDSAIKKEPLTGSYKIL